MPGDLEYVATLDDAAFTRSLSGMDRRSKQSAETQSRFTGDLEKGFKKSFGRIEQVGKGAWLGIAASVPLAVKAMEAYAEINSQARDELAAFRQESKGLWQDIGRDISLSGTGSLTRFVSETRTARDEITTLLAKGMKMVGIGSDEEGMGMGDALKVSQFARQPWNVMGAARGLWDRASAGVDNADKAKRDAERHDREVAGKVGLHEVEIQLDINKAQREGNVDAERRLKTEQMRARLQQSIASIYDSPEKSALLARISSEPLAAWAGALGVKPGMGTAFGAAFNSRRGSGSIGDVVAADRRAQWAGGMMNYVGPQAARRRKAGGGAGGGSNAPAGGELITAGELPVMMGAGVSGATEATKTMIQKFDQNIDLLKKIEKNTGQQGGARFSG